MALPLIGLVGRKRSGKDSVADILAEHGYRKAAFADPLRAMAAAINPLVGTGPLPGDLFNPHPRRYNDVLDAIGYEAAKELYPEVRRFLQVLGTDAVRELLGDDVWVDLGNDRIYANDAAAGPPLAFTDVRFPNEAAIIKSNGGVIVRVARPSLPVDGDAHISETALDDYEEDYTVVNDGSLNDLRVAVDTLVDKLS